MLKTVIQKGSYHDSVVLMLLTNEVSAIDGVKKASVMMATPANKDIYRQSGLATEDLEAAGANDMVIVADVKEEDVMERIGEAVKAFFEKKAGAGKKTGESETVKSWEAALEKLPDANLAVISVAGAYAAEEARRALAEGLNVFLFSDNVALEDEVSLKKMAHEKGLAVMGPDCGTAIMSGVPIAFANLVSQGSIGIIGASGTGIQELTTILDRLGAGVQNAIGTGGRDLSGEVGGITMLDFIDAMEADEAVKVLLVISKPPQKTVREKIMERLRAVKKPVVTVFMGEKPKFHEEGLYHAYTLDEAARLAAGLAAGEEDFLAESLEFREGNVLTESLAIREEKVLSAGNGNIPASAGLSKKTIKAYYSGGTLAGEAAMLIKDALGLEIPPEDVEGYMLKAGGHVVVDLGDDAYTKGKPHPMIDPAKRIECMREALADPETGVILFDVMLGYGSHEDMAGALVPAVRRLQKEAEQGGRTLHFVATVCGTRKDPQGYDKAAETLKAAGVMVCETNKLAVRRALQLIGRDFSEPGKPVREPGECEAEQRESALKREEPVLKREEPGEKKHAGPKENREALTEEKETAESRNASEKLLKLLRQKPRIINIGLRSFAETAKTYGCETVQYDWAPPAGGNLEMIRTLGFLRNCPGLNIDEANERVIAKIAAGRPVIRDVVPAKTVIPVLNEGKVILHAGPPIRYEDMPDPMQGSCVGAVLFEGWAKEESAARALLTSGEITFLPCHHVGAVGPMGGITTANMPVFAVENEDEGNWGYCTMNEGIGKVLRFGAYSEEVVGRLRWMRDVLGPVLSRAVRAKDHGLAVNPMIAKAIAMGDEFHQRNIAASLVFLKELAPVIAAMELDEKDRQSVIRFLSETDQFFLNIMMASAKAVMDGARTIKEGTVVTAMCRNGKEFGIRIAGMGDTWFTGPVNTPKGLYFTGYDSDDGCPDMGDSAITETFGVGGMAMIAAPAVTRFVGAGGYEDALRTSMEMKEITIDRNPNFIIPNWNFQGTCLGIDARLVVEKGIVPVINTGIAHKIAGYGQIGAGTVRPPMECFEKAVLAYAKKLGYRP